MCAPTRTDSAGAGEGAAGGHRGAALADPPLPIGEPGGAGAAEQRRHRGAALRALLEVERHFGRALAGDRGEVVRVDAERAGQLGQDVGRRSAAVALDVVEVLGGDAAAILLVDQPAEILEAQAPGWHGVRR